MNCPSPAGPWIHKVEVFNFRRFSRAALTLPPGITCLIGPSDAGKSTLLTAMEFALWPSYPLTITDNDFHRANVDADLIVTVSIVNPPDLLRTDGKFLTHLMGFVDGHVVEDPSESEGDPTALQVELRVDRSLEPRWNVVKPGLEPRPITYAERASLGVTRVGADPDRHLRWGRGSSLYRLSESTDGARTAVIEAGRTAWKTSSVKLRDTLQYVTQAIETTSLRLRGITEASVLFAATDRDAFARNLSQVALHGPDDVPLSRAGAGSQRITAIAAQLSSIARPGILLLDEIEYGLEPFRVQAIIRMLNEEGKSGAVAQAILTTHSPRAIRELRTSQLQLQHLREGDIGETKCVDASLQGLVRWSPDALLCPRVVVCEGATEVGIVRGLIASMERRDTPTYAIAEPADAGSSSNVVRYANGLSDLGFEVAALYDLDKAPQDLRDLYPTTLRVEPEVGNATEHQLFADLSDEGVRLAIKVAQSIGTTSEGELAEKLTSRSICREDFHSLVRDSSTRISDQVRKALAETANKDSWFKRIDYGETLVQTVKEEIRPNSHLAGMVSNLEAWLAGPHA